MIGIYERHTQSVRVTAVVREDGVSLRDLYAAEDGWNWMPEESACPLPETVIIGGEAWRPHWRLAAQPSAEAEPLTVLFRDTEYGLEAEWQLTAAAGEGPLVQSVTLVNRSGREIGLRYQDMVSAVWRYRADADTHLFNFTRSKLFGFSRFPGEPLAHVGVLEHWFAHNTCFHHNICNEYANNIPTNYPMLPFEVALSAGGRGLYFCHEFSFGRFMDWCESDPRDLTHKTYLWDAGRLTVADGERLTLPPAYLGAFVGDLDTAGNQLKYWFWDFLPRSVRENENEPLLQVDAPMREDELLAFTEKFPLREMGFEIGKLDIAWLDGTPPLMENWPDSDMEKITHWNPHPDKWPHGMTAGRILNEQGLRMSLYMSDTYCRVNIGTPEGREAEKQALRDRARDYGFDTWRSDFEAENDPFDYRHHEGFLEILDYLIDTVPRFRFEHCSGAAALKDFSTMKRINVMTSEDGATALRHRKAFYTNSYMIPPVQIKADVSALCRMPADDFVGENDPFHCPQYIRYVIRSGLLGAYQSEMPLEMFYFLAPNEQDRYQQTPYYIELVRHLKLYRERLRPILRRCDVYHVLPIADNINWDGFFLYNRGRQQGVLMTFKPSVEAADGDNKRIKLKGLCPDARYNCCFEDHPERNTVCTGHQLMEEGIWVCGLSGRHASEMVWIDRITDQ